MTRRPGREVAAPAPGRSAALGFLCMLPLLLAYEATQAGGSRSAAEAALSLPLAPFGEAAGAVRLALLLAAGLLALGFAWRAGPGLVPRLLRVTSEGVLAALLLGPLLVLLLHLLGVDASGLAFTAPGGSPTLAQAARLLGGAAYEEILFRLGAQSLAFLLVLRVVRRAGLGERAGRGVADVVSIGVASLFFAAAHLSDLTAFLGAGGEPFDGAVFTWRACAGMLLGVLFRWRGPGVAAWAHGPFNLALLLGAGPDVFL